MAVTPNSFRGNFPEFQDLAQYPDSDIAYQLRVAGLLLNVQRWGSMLDVGTELYTAHHLALEARAKKDAAAGGIPGGNVGVVNNKSVDKVSIGYDTSTAMEEKAGHWNLTTYGLRFIKLSRLFGAGPIHVGVGVAPPLSEGAWSSPYPFPNPNG